ncbi:hypothetical protein H0H81_009751, partial [Sphagnurus paluster]
MDNITRSALPTSSNTRPDVFRFQVFLTHGLGVGVAIGISYVPGMAVLGQYFHRRRALAMGIATTGSAAGGVIHPIMLNKLFYGSVGFHGGVRASAGLCLGLLAIALPLIRQRVPTARTNVSTGAQLKNFERDTPYVVLVIG